MDNCITSSTGKIWHIKNGNINSSSELLPILLANRGVNEDSIDNFLDPKLKNLLPDPNGLKGMKEAVDRVIQAINQQEKIVVIGDYDVDGITSTALMINYMKQLGLQNIEYYIPHRINDGYGLNKDILKDYIGYLVIAVDNGSTAKEAIDFGNQNNIDIVILDHHSMPEVPPVCAIVNPHRPDEENNDHLKTLCAAGIVYLFLIALNRKLRENNFFDKTPEPELINMIDIVAIGTICDAMPILGINRAIVTSGIKMLRNSKNLGLRALIEKLKPSSKDDITAEFCAFFLGPMLNAPGRIDSAEISLKALIADTYDEAQELALQLERANLQRKTIESFILEGILLQDKQNKFVCVYKDGWHVGVIGIIAGRLKESHNVPSFVISFDENGIGHGSARSTEGINLANIINTAKDNGLLIKGGGHALAAGFSIEKDKIERFIEFLEQTITDYPPPRIIEAEGIVPLPIVNKEFVDTISQLEPFGIANPKPKFVLSDMKIESVYTMGKTNNHLSITLSDMFGTKIKGIAFNSVRSELGQFLLLNKYSTNYFQILGSFFINTWNGQTKAEMNIEDICV